MGDVEMRMVASPASTACSAQAIRVKGITLLRQAWARNLPQVAASCGQAMPRARITPTSSRPAISVRAVINVSGGMVATSIRMKV